MTKEYFPTFTEVNPFNELSDYITKSPPKEKMNNALYRWCMRWFVIYFRRASGKCWLLYYQNEDAYREGKEAKGKIDLKLSKIRKHGTPINKYQYVIDVVSPKRTFYLCFLNVKIYEKWLTKLLELSKEIKSLGNTLVNNNNNNHDNGYVRINQDFYQSYKSEESKVIPWESEDEKDIPDDDQDGRYIKDENDLLKSTADMLISTENDQDDRYIKDENDLLKSTADMLISTENDQDDRYIKDENDLMKSTAKLLISHSKEIDDGEGSYSLQEEIVKEMLSKEKAQKENEAKGQDVILEEKSGDDVFSESSSLFSCSSFSSSRTTASITPPLAHKYSRRSIDVASISSCSPSPSFQAKYRSETIPRNYNQLTSGVNQSKSNNDPKLRYSSMQELRTPFSQMSVQQEMLKRLQEAASSRPLSNGTDYDMGNFTGPRFNYPHE